MKYPALLSLALCSVIPFGVTFSASFEEESLNPEDLPYAFEVLPDVEVDLPEAPPGFSSEDPTFQRNLMDVFEDVPLQPQKTRKKKVKGYTGKVHFGASNLSLNLERRRQWLDSLREDRRRQRKEALEKRLPEDPAVQLILQKERREQEKQKMLQQQKEREAELRMYRDRMLKEREQELFEEKYEKDHAQDLRFAELERLAPLRQQEKVAQIEKALSQVNNELINLVEYETKLKTDFKNALTKLLERRVLLNKTKANLQSGKLEGYAPAISEPLEVFDREPVTIKAKKRVPFAGAMRKNILRRQYRANPEKYLPQFKDKPVVKVSQKRDPEKVEKNRRDRIIAIQKAKRMARIMQKRRQK